MEILILPILVLLCFVYIYVRIYCKGYVWISFLRKIDQDNVKSFIWVLPAISYVDFYGVRGIYFSWLQRDLIVIEWRSL